MVHCQTTTAQITMQRLQHIDFMKGVAIFLVVLGHVYQFCLNNYGTMFKFIYFTCHFSLCYQDILHTVQISHCIISKRKQ